MSLCGCGKPATHMGMCSERWKKRKANNGPAGIKPKDAPVAADPVRQTYGDLADDVVLLTKGRTTFAGPVAELGDLDAHFLG